ncbi:MAG: FAD:protein FMN transferase [Clostridiales bacterium]|nr:FAD:protein FMN transferase [Clostridiales bacterium]
MNRFHLKKANFTNRFHHVRNSRSSSRMFPVVSSLLAFLLLPSGSCFAAEEPLSETGFFLDTVISITIYGTSDSAIMDGCFTLLDEYEQQFSRTIEGSDVWNINHSGGEPTEVGEETAYLIDTALSYAEISDGRFDITITPLAELWDVENNTGVIPSDEDIAEALSHIDFTTVSLDGTTVTLSDPEAEIDLGGIAKGYIADCLKEYLQSEGIESALINLGGNVLTLGAKPDGSNWKIGIRKPFGESSSDLIDVVETTDKAVITSGTYERYFEVDGVIYHHILDTETGYPVENGLTSVTILCESSTEGDALSTTCFVLGLEDGMELVESLDNIEALFISEDLELYYSSGFPEE